MKHTPDLKDLVTALSKAQGQMKPAVFNRTNPHFKNKYADFTSCMDACRIPLSENGLSVMQYFETIQEKSVLVTMLAHNSGQWIKSEFNLNPKSIDSQAMGSCIAYAKRYSLCALLGIVSDEDDDAEAAVIAEKSKTTPQATVMKKNNPTEETEHPLFKEFIENLDIKEGTPIYRYVKEIMNSTNSPRSFTSVINSAIKNESGFLEAFERWLKKLTS